MSCKPHGIVWVCRLALHPRPGVLHPGMPLQPSPLNCPVYMLSGPLADTFDFARMQTPGDLLTGNAAAAPYGNANGYITGDCTSIFFGLVVDGK